MSWRSVVRLTLLADDHDAVRREQQDRADRDRALQANGIRPQGGY